MAHWIIEDHGFGGQTYRCSVCGDSWNDIFTNISMKELCPNCKSPINEENEYVEKNPISKLLAAQIVPPSELNTYRKYEEMESKLIMLSGYGIEKLIELFAAGYTLRPPDLKKSRLMELDICSERSEEENGRRND